MQNQNIVIFTKKTSNFIMIMKRLSIIMMMALPLFFASCEGGFEDLFNDIVSQATGDAQVYVINNNDSGDTLRSEIFEFSVASNIDTTIDDTEISYLVGFSSHTSLEEATIDFPFMFYTLSDTIVGTHYINLQLDTAFIANFDYKEFVNTNRDNVIALIADEETWYIASSGAIQLNEYEGYGGLVQGEFTNIQAYKLTKTAVEEIQDLYNSGDIFAAVEKIEAIPVVFLNGDFNSRNLDVLSFFNSFAANDSTLVK